MFRLLLSAQLLLATAVSGATIEAVVFTGTRNPTVTANQTTWRTLQSYLAADPQMATHTCRVVGFQGFVVGNTRVLGHKTADGLLLDLFEGHVSSEVMSHMREVSRQMVNGDVAGHCEPIVTAEEPTQNGCSEYTANKPLRGPDGIPVFDPKHDDDGCFVKDNTRRENNCYNYGNDILTNSFAQPGRQSGAKWQENTCEDMQRAAVHDGLVFVGGRGKPPPTKQPAHGHLVSMHIWPSTNFHWLRMDSNFTFSHKPGQTAVRDVDNDGHIITDPSKANLAPWTQHCGYFTTIPSKVTIG